jgi:uncharacterized protein YjbI with pentapeptide repeats
VTAPQSPRLSLEPSPAEGPLEDETEWQDLEVTGDFTGSVAAAVHLTGCTVRARLTAVDLARATFTDCRFEDSDLSGASLEELRATRVTFVRCRLTGLVAASARFRDVTFEDCKLDDANLRMTTWERSRMESCDLHGADLYAAKLGGMPIEGCDLRDVELGKADLTGTRLHGSRLDGIRSADRLRGTILGSDQLVPAAEAVFAALGIVVED